MGYDSIFFKDFLLFNECECRGVRGGDFEALYTHGLQGKAPAELLADGDRLTAAGFFTLAAKARRGHPVRAAPYWIGNHNCIRSVYCHRSIVDPETGLCEECEAVKKDKTVLTFAATTAARAKKHIEKVDGGGVLKPEDFKGVSVQSMGITELCRRVEANKYGASMSATRYYRSRNYLHASKALISNLKTSLKGKESLPVPQFIADFIKAHNAGAFNDKEVLLDLLSDISSNLLRTPQGRRHNLTTKALYTAILNHGGPRLLNLVSSAFDGVSLSTTQRGRALFYNYELGYAAIHAAIKHAAHILQKSNYAGSPCLIGEDSTALQIAIQSMNKGGKFHIYGFCGGPHEVSNVDELHKLAKETDYGTALYLYTLIPLAANAPTIVVGAIVHNNTNDYLSQERIKDTWHVFHDACRVESIHLIGHVSDGDSRLRSCDLDLCFGQRGGDALWLDHHLIEMFMPKVGDGTVSHVLATQDWLHLLFRLRVQFLHPVKNLMIGSFRIQFRNLKQLCKELGNCYRMPVAYLSHKNKQDYPACEHLGDIRQTKEGKVPASDGGGRPSLRAALRKIPEYHGTYLFFEFLHRFTCIFVLERSVEDCLKDVGFCITFLGRWHQSLVEQKPRNKKDGNPPIVDLKMNFITMETYKDCLIALNSVVLLALHLKQVEVETGVKQEWVPGRLSSRHVEYNFSFLRNTRGSIITALSAMQSLKIQDCQLHMELFTNIHSESGRRLAKREAIRARVEGESNGINLPDVEAVKRLLDEGQKDCEELLKEEVEIGGDRASAKSGATEASGGGTTSAADATQLNEAEYDADEEYGVDSVAYSDEEDEEEDALSPENPRRLGFVIRDIETNLDSDVEEASANREINAECRYLSSAFEKQKKDRVGGRFMGQDWHANVGNLGSKDDPDYLSDDDTVACVFDDGDPSTGIIEIGIAEGFVVVDGKKAELRHEVHINDPKAEISHVQWLVPVKEEAPKGGGKSNRGKRKLIESDNAAEASDLVARRFKMQIIPRSSAYGNNYSVKMAAVVCPVILRYDPEAKEYILNEQDHKVLNEYLVKYRLGQRSKSKVKRQNSRQHRQAAKKDRQKNS